MMMVSVSPYRLPIYQDRHHGARNDILFRTGWIDYGVHVIYRFTISAARKLYLKSRISDAVLVTSNRLVLCVCRGRAAKRKQKEDYGGSSKHW